MKGHSNQTGSKTLRACCCVLLALISLRAPAGSVSVRVTDGNHDAVNIAYQTQDFNDDGVDAGHGSRYASASNMPPYVESAFAFDGINIPQGSEILTATITVYSWSEQLTETVGTAYLRIRGEASDDANTYNDTPYISDRSRTATSVVWTISEDWEDYDVPATSPDITPLVQAIVSRPGWSSGNRMSIFLSSDSTSGGYRVMNSWETSFSWKGDDSVATQLDITFSDTDLPDIVVGDLVVAPSSVPTGGTAWACVTVANTGDTNTGPFSVDLYADEVSAPGLGDAGDHVWYLSNLDVDERTNLCWQFTAGSAGTKHAYAQADRLGAVTESNEGNNLDGPVTYAVEDPGVTSYYAVVCGVADYPGTLYDLLYTTNDAIDVRNTLHRYPEWFYGSTTFLLDSAATKAAISAAIASVRSAADSNDRFVFFFAGHGTTGTDVTPLDESDNVDEYIVPYDGLSGYSFCIRDDEFRQWVRAFPCPVTVLLDTCHSGGTIRGIQPDMRARGISLGPAPAAGSGFGDDLGGRAVPLGDLIDDPAFIGCVMTACEADELSTESQSLENGVFTEYVLESLWDAYETSNANADGVISAEEIHAYAAPRTSDWNPSQHPQLLDRSHLPTPSVGEQDAVLLDFDGDGHTACQESLAGTDPAVASSVMRLTYCTRSGTDVTLMWSSVAGHSYRVLYYPFVGATPTPVKSGIAANAPNNYEVLTNQTAASGFYDIELE